MDYKALAKAYIKNAILRLKSCLPVNPALGRNADLFNKYRGERLFILGSGGSIKNYDLVQLGSEFVMTQNNFFVHENISEINSNFHCVVPFYQTEKDVSNWIGWIEDMSTRCPNADFFFGLNTKPVIDENFPKLVEKTYYLDPSYDVLSLNRAHADLTKTVMSMQTVTTQCLIVALYLGFSEIYLLGFDNDQLFNSKGNQNRFYGVSRITDTQAERDIVAAQYGKHITKSWFNKWLTSKQCDLLEEFSIQRGARIFNASEEGILDNFERRALRDVLGTDMRLDRD